MPLIKQSTATEPLLFLMVDSSDHITGKTGLTPTVTISKAGGSFASPSGAVSEIANGWYKVAANATDAGTLGEIALHATGTGADPTDCIVGQVVAFDPRDAVRAGLTALPNANAGASGGVPTVDGNNAVKLQSGTGANQISLSSGGVLLQATQTGVTIPAVTTVTNLTNAPTAGDFTSTMKTSIGTAVAASAVASVTGNVGGNVGGNVVGSVGSVTGDVGGTVTGLASKLLKYVQLIVRKDAAIATDNATELTAINANGGAGGGSFANTTDALEASRDNIGTNGAALTGVTGATLASAYDAAKTAAQAGDAMTLEADAVDAAALATDGVAEIVSAIAASGTPIPANVKKVNSVTVTGAGTSLDKWRAL